MARTNERREELKNEQFLLMMKDHWTPADYRMSKRIYEALKHERELDISKMLEEYVASDEYKEAYETQRRATEFYGTGETPQEIALDILKFKEYEIRANLAGQY